MLVALDTNVLVAALLGGVIPHRVYNAFLSGQVTLLFSHETLAELIDVLTRPRLRLLMNDREVATLLTAVHHDAVIVRPTRHVHACRDPKDNIWLDCALAGRADYLVTGDRDLLVLDPFRGIPILRPADFLPLLS